METTCNCAVSQGRHACCYGVEQMSSQQQTSSKEFHSPKAQSQQLIPVPEMITTG